ncbi:MAG TPA: hypothetical protein PKC43_10665 [Phycisphaerales bacterium]|nr:hypothetical protein [Phycisphaerales bacterium]HMP37897.1 hypothetical protein [Phycisphaerales bacterium]
MTGGIDLTVESRDIASQRIVAFTVLANGQVTFSGGKDAVARRVGWTGELTAEQGAALRELLERDGWLDGTAASSGAPRSLLFRAVVRGGPHGSKRYDLRGTSDAAARLEAFLDQATRARHAAFLQSLPEAGDALR